MKRSKFGEAQIAFVSRQAEAGSTNPTQSTRVVEASREADGIRTTFTIGSLLDSEGSDRYPAQLKLVRPDRRAA